MREISVLNILRPHENGPYRLLSILKEGEGWEAWVDHGLESGWAV